jgi:hypothetical protein
MRRDQPPTIEPDRHRQDLVEQLPTLRAHLEEERCFRIEQLSVLAAQDDAPFTGYDPRRWRADRGAQAARNEVNAQLADAARRAQADACAACRAPTRSAHRDDVADGEGAVASQLPT